MEPSIDERQQEELEALRAIYDEDLTVIRPTPLSIMVTLTEASLEEKLKGKLFLKVTFPKLYPDEVPIMEVPLRSNILDSKQHKALISHLSQTATDCVGDAMVYQIVEAGREFLEGMDMSATDLIETPTETANEPEEVPEMAPMRDSKNNGGKWDFVIGLVGKPSAGKSTFFNAATGFESAKTAAHPFTTIDANMGRGFYGLKCPCSELDSRCDAAFGHNVFGERLLPVKLKDVAGLVPGACDGRGRGNRFLNDLLDADVLVHVVDVSGTTDEIGEPTTGHDPASDVRWLHEEIHRWIYDNVMEKWDNLRKRPHKLVDMFTGYHATRATIHAALTSAGVDEQELANLPNWSDNVLHRIVNRFLAIRFPIFLVLNKADTPTAAVNIERLKSEYPEAAMLEVSARAECLLQRLSRAGSVEYEPGAPRVTPGPGLSAEQLAHVENIQRSVLERYGSTNVHRALSTAMLLRDPQHVFPVQCLDTLTSIDKYRDRAPGVLRDCVCVKPQTTVHQVYTALSHYPLLLLAGDFIRAEAADTSGTKKIVRKDDLVSTSNSILKIITNRKVSQVKSKEINT